MLWFLLYVLLRKKIGIVGFKYKAVNKKLQAFRFRNKAIKQVVAEEKYNR